MKLLYIAPLKTIKNLLEKISVILQKGKQHFKALFILSVIYGLSKGVAYFAPIFFNAAVNDVHTFGSFEYVLNLGQILSSALCFGLPGAYAFFIFKEKEAGIEPVFHLAYCITAVVVTLPFLIFPALWANMYAAAVIVALAVANQLYAITYYKLKGRNITAVLVDTGLYFFVLAYAVLIHYKIIPYRLSWWAIAVLLYAWAFILKLHFKKGIVRIRIEKSVWQKVFCYGLLTTGIVLLTGFLTTGTRIIAELFTNMAEVGIYSFYIRIAAAVILLHRVMLILFFRHIYIEPHKRLDNYFSLLLYAVIIFNILFYWLLPAIMHGRSAFFDQTFDGHKMLWFLCLAQSAFWVPVALLEIVLYRENLLKSYLKGLLLLLCLLAAAVLAASKYLAITVNEIVWINNIIIAAMAFLQLYILSRNGILYKRTLYAQIFGTAVFLLLAHFYTN